MSHDTQTCGGPPTCLVCRSWLAASPAEASARYATEDVARGLRANSFRSADVPPLTEFQPPDPYEAALARLRGDTPAPPPAPPEPPSGYEPPDPYAAGIAKMRSEHR